MFRKYFRNTLHAHYRVSGEQLIGSVLGQQERRTDLTFACLRKPTWQVTPAASGDAVWDETRKTLTMKLNHQGGAVEVILK